MRRLLQSALILSTASTLLAQSDTGTPGWVPVLELRAMSSSAEGARANVSGTRNLAKGEPVAATIASGATLCSLGIGNAEMPPGPPVHNDVWKMTGEYLGEQSGRYQIRVTSGFTRLAGQPSTGTTTQTLSLREGDNAALDVLTGPVNATCQVHTVTIDARLVLQATDPALARARYTADLWVVHSAPGSDEQREHLIVNVDGSGAVPFMFNRLSFALPQVDPQQGNAEAFIQVTGALRARLRTDGLVDVDVDTNRTVFGMDRPDKPARNFGSPTRKTLTLKADETTAIEFPPPASGYVMLALGDQGMSGAGFGARASGAQGQPAADGPAVEVRDGRLVLHTNQFFKGHRTQLLVRLRRLR